MRGNEELRTAIRRDARVVVVVNLTSRHARRAAADIAPRLRRAGVPPLAELTVLEPGHLPAALSRAVAMRPDLVVVGGGDGTLSTAAAALAHQDIALGVLPLGTTNNFARSLGVPLDLPAALRTVTAGTVIDVDLGRVTGASAERLFANLTSVGLSVDVADRAPRTLKRFFGRPAYAVTAMRALPRHRAFRATVATDEGSRTFSTHQLNVANGRFHAGFAIAGDASVGDGQLVVYRLGDRPRRDAAAAMIGQLLHGDRRRLAADQYLTAPTVRLVTDPVLPIDVDGEVWGRTPVTLTSAPSALRVMVR